MSAIVPPTSPPMVPPTMEAVTRPECSIMLTKGGCFSGDLSLFSPTSPSHFSTSNSLENMNF